jgi:hypothetical protein
MYGRTFSTVSGPAVTSFSVYAYFVVIYLKNLSGFQRAEHQLAVKDRIYSVTSANPLRHGAVIEKWLASKFI